MERERQSVTTDIGADDPAVIISTDKYEDLLERASIASAMYQDLQVAVRLWRRLREHQLCLVEQCEAIEATRDAVPVIQASMVTLAGCIRDADDILRRYAALDPAQPVKGGEGDADGPESTG